MLDSDLQGFIRASIRSTWALELLLLVRAQPERVFTVDGLVLELRGTPLLMRTCVKQLAAAGLVVNDPEETCRYAPASAELDGLCGQLERAYKERPVAVINAIVAGPNDRLQTFADAFRFTKKDD